jgi:hypothetical protein
MPTLRQPSHGGLGRCQQPHLALLPQLAYSNGDEGWGGGQPSVVDLDRGRRGSEVLMEFGSGGREKRKEEVHKKRGEYKREEFHSMWIWWD